MSSPLWISLPANMGRVRLRARVVLVQCPPVTGRAARSPAWPRSFSSPASRTIDTVPASSRRYASRTISRSASTRSAYSGNRGR
jgi:hypothetical protein